MDDEAAALDVDVAEGHPVNVPRSADELDSRLREAIEQAATNSISAGLFRAPTLETVNRWIDVVALLRAVSTVEDAAFAIASRLTDRGISVPHDTVLVSMSQTPYEFTEALLTNLNLSRSSRLFPESSKHEPPDLPDLPAGTPVLLCTDLVLSANTVRAAVADLIRWNKSPIAVVTIVDARPNRTSLLDILYRHIPIVSCTTVDIRPSGHIDPEDIEDIDPVLLKPLEHPIQPVTDPHPLTPEQFLQWCEEPPDCLYMGHIDRPIARHYTGYIDTRSLIDTTSSRREGIIATFRAAILRHREKLGAPTMELEVWYAGSELDPAYNLAIAIADALVDLSPTANVPAVISIPRRVGRDRFEFPGRVTSVASAAHVVIVDWNCVTGRTLEQMVRLAADSGAAAISAVALISQLAPDDEAWLSEIRSVTARRPVIRSTLTPDDVSEYARTLPVEISFLTRLPIGYYHVADCPLCQLRHECYALLRRAPTALLREHADRRLAELREQDRVTVLNQPPEDQYGVAVGASDIALVIELRERLRTAVSDTRRRLAVRDELQAAASPRASAAARMAWIRLLATEPSWLRMPPLRFAELRALVAQISLLIATDKTAVGIRREAVTVLRAASKRRFLASLYELLLATGDSSEVLDELLWAVFTCLNHPHLQTKDGFRHAIESFENCDELTIFDRTMESGHRPTSAQLHTWDYLQRAARLGEQVAEVSGLSTQDAWCALQANYAQQLTQDRRFRRLVVNTRIGIETWTDHEPATAETWTRLLENITACQDFVSLCVLPYLPAVKDILLSDRYAGSLSSDELMRLLALLGPEAVITVERVAELVAEFADDPKMVVNAAKRESLVFEFQWWYDYFLNAGGPGLRQKRSRAVFLDWVDRCPTDLTRSFEAAVNQMRAKVAFTIDRPAEFPKEMLVFCDTGLVEDALKAALAAAGARGGFTGLISTPPPVVSVRASVDDGRTTLQLGYTATGGELPGDATALDRLRTALIPFGSEVHVRSGEADYRVVLFSFERWSAGPPVG